MSIFGRAKHAKDGDVAENETQGTGFEEPEAATDEGYLTPEQAREFAGVVGESVYPQGSVPGVESGPAVQQFPDDETISPNYYQFPDGTQTIQVTRWLTSNGGQAVQYITRSTRIDGLTKGDQIEDLRKAKVFIDDELTRLEGELGTL